MAQLAFGLGGAAVGSFFGAPGLGFSVGSAIGGLLFPQSQPDTTGPKMGDLSVTSSAYGADIPIGYGTMRVAGNIIWASPIQEVQNDTGPNGGHGKKGGKGSGGTGNVEEFTYYGNWAVAFAQGAATGVTRIWFDGILVFDIVDPGGISPGGIAAPPRNGNQRGFTVTPGAPEYPGLNFRFYPGDEIQVADPLIEAWMALGDVSPPDTHGRFKTGDTPSTPAGEPPKVTPGSQAVPGFRGLCYIIFENWPLQSTGNHIPMVTAEITFGVQGNFPFRTLTPDTDPASDQGQGSSTSNTAGEAVDLQRHVAYRTSSDISHTYIREFDPDTMVESRIVPMPSILAQPKGATGTEGVSSMIMGLDGFLYLVGPRANTPDAPLAHSMLLLKVDANSLKEVDRVELAPLYGLAVPGGDISWGMVSGIGYDSKLDFWVVAGIFNGGVFIAGPAGGLLGGPVPYVFPGYSGGLDALAGTGAGQLFLEAGGDGKPILFFSTHAGTTGNHFFGCVPDPTRDYILQANGICLWLPDHTFAMANPAEIYSVDAVTGAFQLLQELSASDINAAADIPAADVTGGMSAAHGIWADASTSSILFGVTLWGAALTNPQQMLVSWSLATGTTAWVTNLTAHPGAPGFPSDSGHSSIQSMILDHSLAWAVGSPNTVVVINTLDGSITSIENWPGGGGGAPSADVLLGSQVWDGYIKSITSGAGGVKLYIGKESNAGTTVGSIVRDLGSRVGLIHADLDTSDIDGIPIAGYFLGQPTTVRDAILPLAQAYLFDVVESDGIMKFPARGAHPLVRTLTQDSDLAPVEKDTNLVVLETRAQEVDLPVYLAVSYYDRDNNYQQGTRIRRRSAQPLEGVQGLAQNAPTVKTQNVAMLQWPLVLDAQTAAEAADRYLFTTWVSRTTYQQKLHWGHIDLDPSDRIKVQLNDGTTYSERVTKFTVGGDLSIEQHGVAENSATYNSGAQGGDDFGLVPNPGNGPAFTKLILLPTPLLRDTDSAGQEASVLYYAASNYGTGSFPGCGVFKSTDLQTWTQVGIDINKATWGSTASVLPENDDPFSWDDTTEFVVRMRNSATLSNATDSEILAGGNAMAVFNLDGNPEVIQFGTAAPNPDGSYTLTHLLRGRRGSDTWCTNHAAGQTLVLLATTSTKLVDLPLTDLHQLRYFRGVGSGLSIDFADTDTITDPGNDLKPYAPLHDSAGTTGSIGWDPGFDAADFTFSTGVSTDDGTRHAVTDSVFCTARTLQTVPADRCYFEMDRGFLLDNNTSWGFCDATHPTTGTNLGADPLHSVQMLKAIQMGGTRFAIAVDGTALKAWVRIDLGSWLGTGFTAGDPVGGTNGFDLSAIGAPFYWAFSSLNVGETATIHSLATDFLYPVPSGYFAGFPTSDIVISWLRRTRLGGALIDGTGVVALGEASELYDVEIMTGPGTGVVKRTYSAVGAPPLLYPVADVTADWGARPAELTLRIYQLSAVVGRGFVREQTVEVH